MSGIVDEIGEIEAVELETGKDLPEAEAEKSVLDDIPEQYRGKSVKDLVSIVTEKEKMIGRQAQEVGEVRKLADELIKSQLAKKPEEVAPEVDFFEDPKLAVQNAIDSSPRLRQAEQQALMYQRQMALNALAQKHPDYQEINGSQEFQDWISKSKVRANLYQHAQNYDLDAGDELLSTFKELRAVRKQAVSQVETKARDNALSAAAVETSGTNESTTKKYSRRAIIDMQVNNPRKFESMRDVFDAAYRDGRIVP